MLPGLTEFRARARTHPIELGDARVHAVELGAGPPLVLVHGIAGTVELYFPQLMGLADRFRCIGYGYHGDVDLLEWTPPFYRHRDLVDGLVRLFDELGLDDAVLVGSSFGGTIALDFARRCPARVRALVLHATFAHYDLRPFLARLAEAMGQLPFSHLPFRRTLRLLRRMNPWESQTAAQRVFMEQQFFHTPYRTLMRRLHFIRHFDVRAALGRIMAPTLLLWGERDIVVPRRHQHELAAGLPQSRSVVLPGCGHACWISHAEPFNAAIRAFCG